MGFKQESDIWKDPSGCFMKNELNKTKQESEENIKKKKEQCL